MAKITEITRASGKKLPVEAGNSRRSLVCPAACIQFKGNE